MSRTINSMEIIWPKNRIKKMTMDIEISPADQQTSQESTLIQCLRVQSVALGSNSFFGH
jgi:hypothetical protein